MNKHSEFILTPMSGVLEDVVLASSGIGKGIETYPLCDYIMQSVFLKMTGFQEQKLKCISWDMATNDFEYRRILLGNDDKLGECSTYNSKNKIYQRLISLLKKNNSTFHLGSIIDTTYIQEMAIKEITSIFKDTNLSIWNEKSFIHFKKEIKQIVNTNHFGSTNRNLFESSLQSYYTSLYNHRNRCAHNTLSYQQNLPTLTTLSDTNYVNENYFIWFSLLTLIDYVFISLYKAYISDLEELLI